MQALLHVLTAEGLSWALLNPQREVIAVAAESAPVRPSEAFPLPEGLPWPPETAMTAHVPPLGDCRFYPLEDGTVLAVWGASPAALAQALEAERARMPAFISTVTHELRLPLTSIRGYADLLVKGVMGPVSDAQAQFLEVIRNNVERMATLIERVSEMGKLESGRLRPKREPMVLKQAVEAVAKTYRPLCEEKKQTLEVILPEGLPIVQGDMARVVQILTAMMDNAYKYTPEGGKIVLKAAATENGAQVSVCDNGPGVAADDAPRVFEAFFRSEIPEVREHPGWGLSLHVARQLAEQMGGSLTFAEAPKGGVCFTLRLQAA